MLATLGIFTLFTIEIDAFPFDIGQFLAALALGGVVGLFFVWPFCLGATALGLGLASHHGWAARRLAWSSVGAALGALPIVVLTIATGDWHAKTLATAVLMGAVPGAAGTLTHRLLRLPTSHPLPLPD